MLILGVDGGGTKTLARLARVKGPDFTPIGHGQSGGSNPQTIGFDQAAENLRAAIVAAFANAGIASATAAAACLAVAGSDRDNDRARLTELLKGPLAVAKQLLIVNDALPLLAAASDEQTGVALISGTGSFAFGRNAEGREQRCGGWGPLLGDEGSGYRLGIEAIQAILEHADQRGPSTALTERILQQTGLSQPQELIRYVHSAPADSARIASLADVVLAAAAEEDSCATEIVDRATAELGEVVRHLADQLALPSGFDLALSGGLLLNQPLLKARLIGWLQKHDVRCVAREVADPTDGALLIAHRALAGKPNS